ncbi:hypothetical protein RND81_07G052600 [Saponaria officinalis]|uniref:Uncharacterized protein n=1 Tax=Saponaria officinalis TaxID=3572 RepID=A0AAW1JR26_SAPOF
MAVTLYNPSTDAGLKKLDEFLLTRSYISGYQASKDDLAVYAAISKTPSAEFVNVLRWYKHIDALLRISYDFAFIFCFDCFFLLMFLTINVDLLVC